MTEFYVGQRVWCVILGEGVVAEITYGVMYPVKVRFENGEVEPYTSNGHFLSRGNQSLFHHPVKIVQDESAAKPSIDWSHVNENFKWLAMDADGKFHIYTDKPLQGEREWTTNLSCTPAIHFASFVPGTCDWKESLVKRPD